jgi:hypothetical protein
VTPDAGESTALRWFNEDQLDGDEIENDIRLLGKEAIRLLSEDKT